MGLFNDGGTARRNVLLLLQGHCVSKIGTAVFDIAFVLWMKERMGLAGVVGIVMMLAKLPEILLSPLSGTIVDMTSRKKVLVLSDLFIGVLVTMISVVCLARPDDITLSFVLLVAGAICIGICDSFFNPAVASFLPELVTGDNLQSVNSVYRFTTTAATFIGQFAAGILFPLLGAPMLFLLNGASYLFSAGSQVCICPPRNSRAAGNTPGHPFRRVFANLKEGMAYIWNYSGLRSFLVILCVYHFFISPFTVILPFYISDVLHATPAWYGYAMGCFGVGLLIGFILAGVLQLTGHRRACVAVACFGVSAAAFLLIGMLQRLCLVLPLLFVIGVTIAIIVVTLNTIIQQTTPNSMHGRIFGLYSTLSTASIPFGMGFFGIAMDLLRKTIPSPSQAPAMIFLFCGLTLCAIFVFFMGRPSFRNALVFDASRENCEPARPIQ
jgi:DHA3 family macrolide efflux protein-like MFS transporter